MLICFIVGAFFCCSDFVSDVCACGLLSPKNHGVCPKQHQQIVQIGERRFWKCVFFFFFADKVKWQKLVEWLVHYKLLPHKLLVVNKKGVCVVKRSLRSGLSEWRNICQALLRSMCLWCNSCIHCFRPPIKVPTWYTALGVTGKKFYEREKCEFAA